MRSSFRRNASALMATALSVVICLNVEAGGLDFRILEKPSNSGSDR
jgi:hypothetical protein